jgi:hypothetical protein
MANDIDISMDGGCACGGVRYRMTAKPLIVHCCHCRWCQRESGSAFALNAMVEADRVEVLKGDPATVNTPSASGNGQKIVRCPICHVALWSHYAGAGDKISFVRVGSLDTPDTLPPDVHIYTSTKQPWVVLPDGAMVFEEFYNPREVWPPESLARAKAARG